ncbi:MAG: GAF domain-containing protein [Chitinivibrionales bacterium]|nr:GAF domain-containing protein [Chitinivibrionales bacterium]
MKALRHFAADCVDTVILDKSLFCLGTDEENDIRLCGSDVPAIACKLEIGHDAVLLETMKSAVVKVNGKKVKTSGLLPGDRLEIGSDVFVLDLKDDAPASGSADETKLLPSFQRFCEAVGRERNLQKLLHRLIESLLDIVGGEEAFIFVLDPDKNPVLFVSSGVEKPQERFSDTIVQEVLASQEGIVIANALSDPKFASAQSITDLQLKSVLCAPLKIAGNVSGVVYIGSKSPAVSFDRADLATLNIFAMNAAMLIRHVEFITQQNSTIHKLSEYVGEDNIIASSDVMVRVLEDVHAVAQADISVLLQGETGAGKDVLAQIIHKHSMRKDNSFVPVNCSSLRGELLESELYGHKRGAFTGAVKDHRGLFAEADGGTLFLDEISEMDVGLQAKLLRTLEVGAIRSVGASSEQTVDVRIICATNRNLDKMVAEGSFRKDLYFRLNQYTIDIPPLRNRGNDIQLLAYFFLEHYKAKYPHKQVVDFHPATLKAMLYYEWPGNVRELSSLVHKAVLSAREPLIKIDFRDHTDKVLNFEDATKEYQLKLIKRALGASDGNREKAARLLGMSRSSFFRYLAQVNKDEEPSSAQA